MSSDEEESEEEQVPGSGSDDENGSAPSTRSHSKSGRDSKVSKKEERLQKNVFRLANMQLLERHTFQQMDSMLEQMGLECEPLVRKSPKKADRGRSFVVGMKGNSQSNSATPSGNPSRRPSQAFTQPAHRATGPRTEHAQVPAPTGGGTSYN